jgi:hypothetical protein
MEPGESLEAEASMQIFISYAGEDRIAAEGVHLALVGAGHTTFFDKQNLPPGGDYHSRIAAAVGRCDAFVFMLSPDAIAPGCYALTELKLAKARWAHPVGRVLPVMARAVPFSAVPPYLGAVTALVPEGNLAAEVTIAVGSLAAKESPAPPTSPPPSPALPSALFQAVTYQHNIVVPTPNGPAPGMQINTSVSLHNAAGRTVQLVVRFSYSNGPPLYANAQEMTFRDPSGLVATWTPAHVAAADEAWNLTASIPYFALNFMPTNGMAVYNLALTAFVYADQRPVAQSAPVGFTFRW